jgi:hypothetical protein
LKLGTAALASTALLGAAALVAPAGAGESEIIGPDGVGEVTVGAKHSKLKEAGLVGKLKPGCELAEADQFAKLKAPLEGSVNFTPDNRADSIVVAGGEAATDEGVTVGSRRRKVKKVYPNAKFNKSTESVFGVIIVTIPKRDGGRFELALDETKHVSLFGVPFVPFCE